MAITTTNGKLSVMEMDVLWEPGLPVSPVVPFAQGTKQQLLWGFAEVLWSAGVTIGFYLDLNTRLREYLATFYSITGSPDLTMMTNRYLNGLTTGDRTDRMRKLIQDATEAMP